MAGLLLGFPFTLKSNQGSPSRPRLKLPSRGRGAGTVDTFLLVDSLSIRFNHHSFQAPIAVSPGFWAVFWKENRWKEWTGKLPLEF